MLPVAVRLTVIGRDAADFCAPTADIEMTSGADAFPRERVFPTAESWMLSGNLAEPPAGTVTAPVALNDIVIGNAACPNGYKAPESWMLRHTDAYETPTPGSFDAFPKWSATHIHAFPPCVTLSAP